MAIATSKNDIDNIKIEENYDNRNIKCCIHKSSNASNLKNTKPESLRNNSITGSCSLKKATNSTNNSLKNNKIKDKRKHSENFISHDTSVAERIQQWNRAIPQTSYVTLGTIRYGIRLSTNSDPSNFHSEKTSNSSSSSKSLPPTPYSTRSNKLIKNRRGSEQNEIKSNISSGSDSSCQSFKNTYISSNLNIDISNNSGSNNSNSNSSKSDNNIQDISNKENSSSNSKTSSIYHCESEKSNSSNKNCCKSACCCLYKRGIAIPCWNKNLCNRNNNNDSSIRKKCNEQDNDIPLETFTVKSANYRIPTRTTTTTSTKKSSISTKKSQFPSISSFSSTELSPSITYPFSRSTVMSAPKIDCLATSTTLSESSAEIATTTATIAHITDTTKFENQHKILLNDDINAPIPPIRTTSQIPYLKSLENNNGKAYNNGNINNNYSNNNNNNTIIKTSRLKSNQKHDETKNLTKIPTAAVNNSHLDNHFMYIVSSTSTQLPSLSSSSSISQAPLSSTTALSSATLSPLGSITTTRIITKNAIPSYTQSYKKDIVLNEVNAENYSKHTNNITKLCNNCFINQQYNYNNYHQLQQENNSIKINGSSSHHHHEKNYKMCQTPSCSCSNIKNSVVKNSNDHVCCSHHEIKNTTDEQQNHQQQQQQQQNTNENEFGQNSRDNNIENSSSVLAETRTCKFTKIISPPSLALRENFDIISYPLQNSKSLPISSSLLTKHQNSKHISFGNNSNNNNEKNGINNTFNNNFIQRNGTNENCTIAKSSCNLKDIKDNSNFKNQNDQNNYENISLKNNSSNNFKCSGNFDCSCSNNNKEILQNKNNYLPQPQKIYGGSIPRAIIQQTLDTVAQRSLGTDRKNSDTNGYDKTKTCIITPSTNGFNTLRQRRLSPPPPVPPKPNRHQQVVRSKSVDSNVNNYQNSTDSLTEHIINSSKDINENQNFNQNYYNESTTDFNNINNNNKSNNCDSDSISSAAYDPSKFRRKLLKFEQKNFIIKKSPSAGLDLLNCFAKSNTSDDNSTVSRQSGSSNDLANINSIVSTNNIRNKNHHQNGINRSFSYNNTTSTAKLKDNKGNHNGVNNKIDTNNSPFLQRKTSIVSAKNQQNSESDITSEIKLYSNTTPSVVIRKLTPKLTRKTLNFGSNNDSNSNIYIKNRAVSEDRLIDDNSSDNNDLNSYCDSLGSVNDPIIDTHSNNTNINNNSNSDPNFLIFGEPIPLVPIYKKTKTIISPILYNEQTSTLKCKSIDSQSTDDIGFIDSSEKEDSDFDLHLISNDNNQYNNNNNSLLRNILDYPKSVTIQKNSHFNLQFDSNTKLLQLNKENDKTKFINETNNNTINNNNNNNAINDNTNNKINDHTSIINDRIIFKDFYDSLSDSLETSTISCLSETTTATTTTTDLLTNINCGCRFQNNNNNNNNTIINSNHSNISLNNNEICNSNENITKSISDIDLCLLNNINENGLKKSPDLCCCNERVKRFCRELKNQEVDHSKNLQNNNNNISVDNKIHINNDNNKQIRIFKSNSENFIRNKEFINQFLVNHLNNHNQNLNSNIINSNISSDDKTKAHNNNNILIDNNIKRNTYNNNKNITNFDLNYPIISSSSSTSTIISPTNSSTSIPLSSLPPLPPPLPPLQFRNNHNNNNNNITIDNNNSEKIRYDWNELSADLNSISYNSSSDSNSIHSNNSNQSSISNISSNINCCGGNNNNNNLQKNIQFKKIPSIESFGYINNNNLFFGKLRNIEDNNNSIQDKDQPIKAVVKNNMERRRNTLDRLQDQIRLNFGRRSSPSPTQQEKQRKSAEKSEKLRELTELLRGSPSSSSHSNRFSPTPPPIPPPRKPRQSSQQSSFEKSTEKLPPDPGPPPSPVSPLRAADSDDILPMDQEIEDEPHRYSAPQLTSSSTNSGKITQSPSPPPLPPPPPPPLPPQPLFSTQSTFNIHLKSKKKNEEKPLTAPIHESTEQNHKSLLMSSLRPNSSVSNLEAFIFGRSSRGKSKSPPPFTSLITKSTSKDESTSAEDDICTSLPKPESRTIIGSYTQKGIPYRSASFSQIDYSSGKYVKSALNAFRERFRKSQDKNQADSVVDRTNLTLPRKKDDQDISSQETKTKEPDFIYIPLKKSELSINLRYDENEKPSLEDRVNPPEIIMEEDSQMSELDSPMRTEADISPDISEASDSVIVPTTILEGKSDENQNKIFPKSSPINVSREGSTTSELTNSNGKDLLMESPPDKVKTTTTCLIPIPVYESTDFNTFESKDVLPDDSQSVEGIPTVLEEEPNISLEKPQQTHDNSESPDNVPRISVSQNTPQGSIDEEGDSPSLAGEINPERLTVDQTFDEQPTVPTLVEEVLNRPLEFTEVKKRYSNEAAIGDRSHSADSILSRGGHSDEKRKRDKSKRRMGLYFQWPAVETTETAQANTEWNPSIESSPFEDKTSLPLDITKVDFSNLKSDGSQNETLSLFLNDTLNQSESMQTPESGYICEISTPESESYSKPKIWSRFNRRTSLTCQSSEEKDDGSSPAPSINRSNRNLLCFKNDSTSDNESDRTPPPSRDRTSPSPAPGDSDFKRYSKRPLRGPYGQMLEAEMKKPGKVHYDEIFDELKENDNLHKTQTNRPRGQNNRSFDDTRTIPQHSNSMRVRKTANLPIPTHTRAASTPSQMESTSSSPGSNRASSKEMAGSLEEPSSHLTAGKTNKKYSNDMHRERSPKRASSEAPDMKLINHTKRSPSSASDRHQFVHEKAQKRSFEEVRFSQSSRTNSERSTMSESSKSGGGGGGSSHTNLMPSPELLAALLKGSSERQISEQRQQTIADTRNHIVEEIYRTEASYVDALTTIVTKYYNVLKTPECAGLIDTKAVDEIFFMSTELLSIHRKYYNDLNSKPDPLDPTLCCESFLETFSQTEVLETYTCFVNNRDRAHEAVKTAVQARPAFGKFLEATAREQKGKLSLDNLLIKPIQKFVNYEMLFTRLLKHTDSDIDQKPIQDVLKLVHDILLHLDCKKKEINENGQREDALRQYETYIEGISDLVAPERQFLIYDLVQLPSHHTSNHMRGLFLFSDLLVITSIKRRSGAIKKQDFRSNTSTLDINFASTLENIKYKFLRKFPLEYVEIVKTQDENARRIEKDYEQLVDDRSKIQQIDSIQTSIKFQSALHQVLEQTIRNYLSEVETRLTECERQLNDGQFNSLKFMINIPGDSQHVTVLFGKAERRAKWEELFNDAKQKLAACLERHPTPEFLRSIALRKTRAGLQFTCAAPTLTDQKDVWVCNSDGYIGQVAVLSIQENPPTVSSCNGVCNARILCIASVPAYKETKSQSRQSSTEEAPQSCRNSSSSDNSKKTTSSSNTTATTTTTTGGGIIKESCSMPAGISAGNDLNEIQLDSNSSSDDSDPEQLGNISGTNNEAINVSGTIGVVGGNPLNTTIEANSSSNQENRISSPIPKTISSISNLSTIHHQQQDSNSDDMESQQSTMWLGTEDGCIHVYNSTDNIRIKKNKIKIEHSSSVYSILYYDNKVFVSLANGDICVYLRDNVGWNTSHPLCISIGTVSSPVNKLLNVNGKLWCTIQGTIKVLDTKTLQVESTIQISSDSKPITNMAMCNNCVWISIQNSAIIKCFHSTSHELIFEVNLAPSVNKMLSNCDDIIRQHKAACLRVTSLLACKDLIWIGTSAGVLLTIPAQSYIKGQTNNAPAVTGIPHGHTGHVRFLTSVESNLITATSTIISSDNQEFDTISSNNSYNLNNNNNNNNSYNNNNNINNNSVGSSNIGNASNNRSNSRTRSEIGSSNNLNSCNITTTKYSSKSVDSSLDRKSKRNTIHNTKDKTKAEAGKTLIISGGDGYENFGNSNSNSPSEIAGREDSTNHLLLWQI